MTSRRELRREKMRDAILEAAAELFSKKGYRQVTMDEIAQAVLLSPAALYSYFPSKKKLYTAVVVREASKFLSEEVSTIQSGLVEALRNLTCSLVEFAQNKRHFYRLFTKPKSEELPVKDERVEGAVKAAYERLRKRIEQILTQHKSQIKTKLDLDPEVVREFVQNVIESIVESATAAQSNIEHRIKLIEQQILLLLAGLQAEGVNT